MSASSYQLPYGYGADAKLNYTDYTKTLIVGFPPINGSSSGAKWGGGNASFHVEGGDPVTLRVAIYTHGQGYRVSKVVANPGDRVNLTLQTNDYRIVVTRVNTGKGSASPVALAIENLLAA